MALSALPGCAGSPTEHDPNSRAEHVQPSAAAGARVNAVRARFAVARRAGWAPASPFIGPGRVERLLRSGDTLVPAGDALEPADPQGLDARLSLGADGETEISHRSSGMAVRLRLEGAIRSAEAALGSGLVVYERATAEGATVLLRVSRAAVEDYLVFDARPQREAVSYSVEMRQVAGLRLVANVLELLDASGTPRLRVAPPELVDAEGAVHAARLEVDGCKTDTNPVVPWGRAVTAPGSNGCRVQVRWEHAPVNYPAVLDPKWSSTGEMVTPRIGHAAVRMKDGRVLVTGDEWAEGVVTSEVFDPGTQTWAVTSPMIVGRFAAPGVLLDDGRVMVVGGVCPWSKCPIPYEPRAEIYDPSTAAWQPVPGSPLRGGLSATKLLDGRVLAVSGTGTEPPAVAPMPGVFVFDPALGTWKTLPELPDQYLQPPELGGPGMHHTASLLHDGRVLIAGGWHAYGAGGAPDQAVPAVALFDPKADTWSIGAPLHQARLGHVATTLSDGRVLVVGGNGKFLDPAPVTGGEIYDPAANSWTEFPAMPRSNSASVLRQDGTVLLAGGTLTQPSAELFDPATLQAVGESMPGTLRGYHTATALADGRALIAGGVQLGGGGPAEPSSVVLSAEPLNPPQPDAGAGGAAGAAGAAGAPPATPGDDGCGCRVARPLPLRLAVSWPLVAPLAFLGLRRRGDGKKMVK